SPDEQDVKKVSIPEFTGNVTFANSELVVQNLHLRAFDSADISGEGRFNLDTYAYALKATGKNVDLANLSDAALEGVQLAGTADVSITGQGKWGDVDDWSDLNLNAEIQGHNVMFNGRDLGNARLTANTEGGLLKVEATANVVDQPKTLVATVDLRDRESYPVSANLEFIDADIGPYLALVAPELSGISGIATGSIKLSGPLKDTNQIKAVASLSKLQFGGAINEQRYTISNQGPITVTATPLSVTVDRVTLVGEGTSVVIDGTLTRDGG